MLLLSISALMVFSLTVGFSQGYYYENRGSNSGGLPMCPTPANPCQLRVNMRTSDGVEVETISTGTCTCSPPRTCPQDWNTPRQVVSRRVVSTTHNMTLQMLFCEPVEPKEFCRRDNISLVVRGSMAMPQDIFSYDCRCRRRQPLVLKERSIGLDHYIYHSYACANHVDICARTETCMVMHHTSTDYPCKCANGFVCRIPRELWGSERSYGYCRP